MPPSPSSSSTPIRILCLHGYTQSGTLFSSKTGALRKALTSALSPRPVELHYPTGPLVLRPEDIPGYVETSVETGVGTAGSSNGVSAVEAYGWWRRTSSNISSSGNSLTQSQTAYTGLSDTFSLLADTIKQHGPFDGVLGFSQGACLAGMLAGVLEMDVSGQDASVTAFVKPFLREEDSKMMVMIQRPFKFAVLVSGFKARLRLEFLPERIQTRSLHVLGSLDVVVDEERSRELVEWFEGAEVVVHPGGHFVPNAKVWVGSITGFVRRCLG